MSEYGAKTSSRDDSSSSLPIETQVSVTTTSAPVTAATGSGRPVTEPPVVAAIFPARSNISSAGR